MSLLHSLFFFPLLTGAAFIAVVSGGALLFLRLKKQMQALTSQVQTLEWDAASSTKAIGTELTQMRSRLEALEQSRSSLLSWMSQTPAVNLNRRGHVLRLYRRGDSIAEIASGLRLSQGEVKLIVKVHELSRAAVDTENR